MPKSRDDFFIGHEETYTDRRIKIHVANEKLAKFGVTSFSLPFMKILLSSCLLGINTQWNEDCKKIGELVELVKSGKAVFMCPEQAGGLPTPREHSEIEQGRTAKDVLKGRGRVLTKSGKDVSKQYVTGARRILKFCQEVGVEIAVLKARNPACGSKKTLDGTFAGTKRPGKGVTTKLLSENGIKVYNEDNFPEKILNKA